jgi:hypothetical protein
MSGNQHVGIEGSNSRITGNLDITPRKGLPTITHKASGLLYCPIVRRRNRE